MTMTAQYMHESAEYLINQASFLLQRTISVQEAIRRGAYGARDLRWKAVKALVVPLYAGILDNNLFAL